MVELEGLEPSPVVDKQRLKMIDKYKRRESRLYSHLQDDLGLTTSSSKQAMDEKFGNRKWYKDKVNDNLAGISSRRDGHLVKGTDDQQYYSASDLSIFIESPRRMLAEMASSPSPFPFPGTPALVSTAGMWNLVPPIPGSSAPSSWSINIVAGGTAQIQLAFSAADQSATVSLFQGRFAGDLSRPIIPEITLNGPGTVNSRPSLVNIANGNVLTLVRNGSDLGSTGLTIANDVLMTPAMIGPPTTLVSMNMPVAPVSTFWAGDGKWGKSFRSRRTGKGDFRSTLLAR
jgi:hypothetical protein